MTLQVPWLSIHLPSEALPGGGPDTPLSVPSEIKLSVTAAVADCIMDAVLGELTIAQCKLVRVGACQSLWDGDEDARLGCGMGIWVVWHFLGTSHCSDHGFAVWEAGQFPPGLVFLPG